MADTQMIINLLIHPLRIMVMTVTSNTVINLLIHPLRIMIMADT